jgi:NADP-dependent 3-hydroxy acid dehydrogenase YdfG
VLRGLGREHPRSFNGFQLGSPDINLTGTLECIRAVAPAMTVRKHGRIIVTSSTQGRHGMRDGAGYSASKWALLGLMKSRRWKSVSSGLP